MYIYIFCIYIYMYIYIYICLFFLGKSLVYVKCILVKSYLNKESDFCILGCSIILCDGDSNWVEKNQSMCIAS